MEPKISDLRFQIEQHGSNLESLMGEEHNDVNVYVIHLYEEGKPDEVVGAYFSKTNMEAEWRKFMDENKGKCYTQAHWTIQAINNDDIVNKEDRTKISQFLQQTIT